MTNSSTPLVLVADADRIYRERLAFLLMQEGFEVVCVDSGRVAINTICKSNVDVAIIDDHLSDFDGHILVPILRDMDHALRIVVTTAEHTDELETCVRRYDIAFYGLKSEGYQQVVDAVRTAARSRQRLRELRPA